MTSPQSKEPLPKCPNGHDKPYFNNGCININCEYTGYERLPASSKKQEPHEHIYRKHYATSDEFCVICREPRCTNNADCLVHDGHPIPPLSLKGSEELENILLGSVSFQHILKFAPQSQRELMTFEIAKFFSALLSNKEREARIDELTFLKRKYISIVTNERSIIHAVPFIHLEDRLKELTGVNHKRGGKSND